MGKRSYQAGKITTLNNAQNSMPNPASNSPNQNEEPDHQIGKRICRIGHIHDEQHRNENCTPCQTGVAMPVLHTELRPNLPEGTRWLHNPGNSIDLNSNTSPNRISAPPNP